MVRLLVIIIAKSLLGLRGYLGYNLAFFGHSPSVELLILTYLWAIKKKDLCCAEMAIKPLRY
jgi:hypothetical protein